MTASSRRSPWIMIICLLLALVCAIATIFYWTQQTSLFAGSYGVHHKHALIFGVLTLVFLAGALLFRPRRSVLG